MPESHSNCLFVNLSIYMILHVILSVTIYFIHSVIRCKQIGVSGVSLVDCPSLYLVVFSGLSSTLSHLLYHLTCSWNIIFPFISYQSSSIYLRRFCKQHQLDFAGFFKIKYHNFRVLIGIFSSFFKRFMYLFESGGQGQRERES